MKKIILLTIAFYAFINVRVFAQCQAGYTYLNDTVHGLTTFTGNAIVSDSLAYPIPYTWDFGDGSTATGQVATHGFMFSMPYSVCLTINTSNGCANTYCDTITAPVGYNNCSAIFTMSFDSVAGTNHIFNFFNYSTPDNGATIVSYHWSFGDSTTSNIPNPIHVYTDTGEYHICLTIVTSSGCTHSACVFLIVDNPCMINANLNVQNPSVFGGNDGAIQTTVTGGVPPFTFVWNTGQTTANISNLTSGIYSLTITDSTACYQSFVAYVFQPIDTTGGPIIDSLVATVDTCLTFIPDTFYVENVNVIAGNLAEVTWAFLGNGMIQYVTGTYQYSLTGNYVVTIYINCNAKSLHSYTSFINIKESSGIPNNSDAGYLKIFPNPASDLISVQYNKSFRIMLKDFSGQILMDQNSGNLTQWKGNISQLASGIYFIQIFDNKKILNRKLIIAK
ncbi:MAG: PKD domain-containing protein [Bacteroidota bacterium]